MFTKHFWAEALERALKTFAQALIAILSVDGLGLHEVDWTAGLSVAALAALASVLTSVVSAGPGPSPGTASALPDSLRPYEPEPVDDGSVHLR